MKSDWILCYFLLCCSTGRLATSASAARFRYHSDRHRSAGLLHFRRMGHPQSAGRTKRKVLQLLRRTISGYHIQHNDTSENPFLHRQSDHTVRWHFGAVGAGILFAERIRREDLTVYQYSAIAHCVLLAVGRNHSAHIADGAVVGQISAVYHVAGHTVGCGDDQCVKCELSVSGPHRTNCS